MSAQPQHNQCNGNASLNLNLWIFKQPRASRIKTRREWAEERKGAENKSPPLLKRENISDAISASIELIYSV
jgi:hypothetical protein